MKKLVYSLMLVALLVFAGCEKEWWLLPDVTDTTDTTYVPDTIDTPDVPDTIDTPDVPDTIDTPDVPDTTDTPDEPDTIDTPAVPILSIVDGNNQTAVEHTTLPLPLRVCVSMQTENGRCFYPHQTVRFSVEEGGGHVSSATVLTGSDGMAQVTWTLGNAGVQAVTAVVIDPDTREVLSSMVTFRSIAMPAAPSGDGLFSVSAGRKVRFAPGNLVYSGGYHFTAHQYDYGGYFGWGTGSNPTNTSTDELGYPTFDDWGNHIAGGWRTLTFLEWAYVIYSRDCAHDKRGAATVCGVPGVVLLPDNFSGGTFHAGFGNFWSTNVYDASSWSDMEAAGAVFFPAAGYRYGTELDYVGDVGDYWASTPSSGAYGACYMSFDDNSMGAAGGLRNRCLGKSVRLVQDY